MTEILSTLLSIAVLVFSVASMLSVGLAHTVRELVSPLRNLPGVARALVANFVLVPLLAFGVTRFLSLDPPLEIGLLLVSMAAGAPFLIKLTARADHDVGLGAALLVLLLPATVVYMPIVLPLVLPDATVSASAIAVPLVLTLLAPLGVGLLVRARSARWAMRLLPLVRPLSTVALLVLVAATVWLNMRAILGLFGSGGVLAAVLVIGGAFAIGYALGGRDRESRGVLALGTAQRNIAAATVVATQDFDDPRVLVMVVVASLVTWAVLFPVASLLRKRTVGTNETKDDRHSPNERVTTAR